MNKQLNLSLQCPRKIDNDIYNYDMKLVHMFNAYEMASAELQRKINTFNEVEMVENNRPIAVYMDEKIASIDDVYVYLKKKSYPLTIDSIKKNVKGLARVNVTCSCVDDIYKLIDYINFDKTIEIRKIYDYNKKPKANGYRGIHLLLGVPVFSGERIEHINVKVKLRTVVMDFMDSYYMI